MPESSNIPSEAGVKRPAVKPTIRGVVGAVVLGLAGIGMLGQILCAVFFGQFVSLAVCVGGVGLVWLLTSRVRVIQLRIFLRAFAFAAFLWPFIPQRSVEWSSPWPPAGYWVLKGLRDGDLMVFQLVSIVVATLVLWLAGSLVYQDRHRHNAAS
jgi:hypothetical protein